MPLWLYAPVVAASLLVKRRRFGVRGGDQLHLVLVKCVDQRDETSGFVAPFGPQLRNADHDHSVIMACHGKIV